ncbi:hypothetical protein [Burkholderia ubonensis]|uniref:Uncharacterized protein n=1 Tax=Burkholderia ubonensis TaxID=101571 RepID=A0A119M5Q6_9BURK|nr:hypothetical protein [Burkholderia ubonensis]KWD75489.1 hypothetical protein WL71_31265 [Burkholderia ubonensis]KWD78605.1 hypothetical protein WL70_22195 [Burkholderia ubonensis]KWD96214.1 hypothetical protein WL73_24685 [Burkholderia ubonensis]KWE04231.1 hypothetical protein WL72_03045 [Burkholderia ubonensis]
MTILISVVGTVILLAVASPRLMRAWCKELPGGTRASARGSHTLRHPHDTVRDAAREAARFAALDARAADACATELERLASAGSTRAASERAASERAADDFPSTLARKQLVRERARKAREHATRARAHAGAARSVLQRDARHDDDSQREDELRRHACLANQAHLNARDLLEFTLASEKRSDL